MPTETIICPHCAQEITADPCYSTNLTRSQNETAQTLNAPAKKLDPLPNPHAGEPKPLLRGWLHAGITPLAIAAGTVLICLAQGGFSKAAAAVFLSCSVLLFGHSAIYHRFNWSTGVKTVLRRIDHANIFLLIAGTYTPVAVGTLPLKEAAILLTIVWIGALLGITFRVCWLNAPRWLYVVLYIALGWAAALFFKPMFTGNTASMILVLIGGVLYTVGAIFYAFKWPLRANKYFGFHELFHACTVAAFFCQWTGALVALLNPVYLR